MVPRDVVSMRLWKRTTPTPCLDLSGVIGYRMGRFRNRGGHNVTAQLFKACRSMDALVVVRWFRGVPDALARYSRRDGGHVLQGHRSHLRASLPELPSAGRDCTDVVVDVQR